MESYIKILVKSLLVIGLLSSFLQAESYTVKLDEPSIVQKLHFRDINVSNVSQTGTRPLLEDPKILQKYQIPNSNKNAHNNNYDILNF